MNKKELVVQVAEKLETTQKEATPFVDAVFEAIQEALVSGDEVNIHGFGKFSVGERAARKGRNPQDGSEIEIPASKTVKFKALKNLKESIKNS